MSARQTFLALAALTVAGTATATAGPLYHVSFDPNSLLNHVSNFGSSELGLGPERFSFFSSLNTLTNDDPLGFANTGNSPLGGSLSPLPIMGGKTPTAVPEPDGFLLASAGLVAVLGFGLLRSKRQAD